MRDEDTCSLAILKHTQRTRHHATVLVLRAHFLQHMWRCSTSGSGQCLDVPGCPAEIVALTRGWNDVACAGMQWQVQCPSACAIVCLQKRCLPVKLGHRERLVDALQALRPLRHLCRKIRSHAQHIQVLTCMIVSFHTPWSLLSPLSATTAMELRLSVPICLLDVRLMSRLRTLVAGAGACKAASAFRQPSSALHSYKDRTSGSRRT